ncbi:MAG: GNAT family N-acetyltransferase, partial [Bdellovibrionota bacterium]
TIIRLDCGINSLLESGQHIEDEEVFVAVEDEKIVGFVSIYLPNNFIHNLFILPEYQGRGIGKILLEKVLTFIVEPITLKVEIPNINACLFYEKFGFKKISAHENEEKPYYLYKYICHEKSWQISFEDITKENYLKYITLKVKQHQEEFIASNVFSLAQALFYSKAKFQGILANKIPIGFYMTIQCNDLFEYEDGIEQPFLWRFMIDKNYQSKGFGKKALISIIEKIKQDYEAKILLTSCISKKGSPEEFYLKIGFKKTFDKIQNENILKLELSPSI